MLLSMTGDEVHRCRASSNPYLEAHDLWLDKVERLAVDLNKTLTGLFQFVSTRNSHPQSRIHLESVVPCSGRLYTEIVSNQRFETYFHHKRTSRSGLLLAEALDALGCGGHICDWLYRDDCRVEVRSSSAYRRWRLQILFPDVLALTPPRLSKFWSALAHMLHLRHIRP